MAMKIMHSNELNYIGNTFNSTEFQELIDTAIKELEHKYLEKHSMVIKQIQESYLPFKNHIYFIVQF